jgi:hypothetical protein
MYEKEKGSEKEERNFEEKKVRRVPNPILKELK